jgi:hypothetical protein
MQVHQIDVPEKQLPHLLKLVKGTRGVVKN